MAHADGIELVGYHDLEQRPGFKMGMQRVGSRWYLYLGHLWHSGWSVVDVTNPATPELVSWIEGPSNTWTLQVQVADQLMITSLEPILEGWGGDPEGPSAEEGLYIWDLSEPVEPRLVGEWATGGRGTHRNFYSGGGYVHTSAALSGYDGHVYSIVDISDPTKPTEVGRWSWPGQWAAGGEKYDQNDANKRIDLHGGPYAEGNRVYCPWSGAGMVILDIENPTNIRLVSSLQVQPPLGSAIAVHTVVPFLERNIAIINSEALSEAGDESLNFAGIVDLRDEREPRLISLFPVPVPPVEWEIFDFADSGGRFGPHNQHQPQHQPSLLPQGDLVHMTYFNAGLQVFDIHNPRLPRRVGHFIPDPPVHRLGPLPIDLSVQAEDVLVDARGYVYMTEKNSGLYVLRVEDSRR